MKTLCGVRVGDMKNPDPEKKGLVDFVDLPMPKMGPQDVRIKVAYCAICGSDPHVVAGCFGQEEGDTTPIPLGHEISGIVVELGPEANHKGLKVGDKVAGNFLRFCGGCYYCQNGQQQFCENAQLYNRPGDAPELIWHEDQVYKLPEGVGLKKGCLLEPMSIIVRMLDKANMKAGMTVCVCGGGPIGLMALQAFGMYGACELTMIEPIADRLEIARKYGAVHTIDPIHQNVEEEAMKITEGRGFDVVLDCSGSKFAAPTLPPITAKCGMLIYGAQYPNDYEMPFNLSKYLYFNEITVTGVMVAPYAYPRALQMLKRMQLDELTQKIFDLDDGIEAFEAQLTGKYPKILIRGNKDIDD
ncbi:MAG: alcohol dehydrogenase catalytic domain-containing protein [Lachnospiraceae bacterium]|nr:alcohol dehydrogenase catalytic domain-containing protein [Lachnospiraceae bacterium]